MVGTVSVSIKIELTNREQIHFDDWINDSYVEVSTDVMLITSLNCVVVKGVSEVAKRSHYDKPHDVEDFKVTKDLAKHRNKMRCLLEEPHPLEHSDPEKHAGKPTPNY